MTHQNKCRQNYKKIYKIYAENVLEKLIHALCFFFSKKGISLRGESSENKKVNQKERNQIEKEKKNCKKKKESIKQKTANSLYAKRG